VGGHDRGLDWSDFAAAMRARPPAVVVTMGANGPGIHARLAPVAGEGGFLLRGADGLEQAVAAAREALAAAGRPGSAGRDVLLLSPGAPSFGAYRDYVERGRHFARLGGFDPEAIAAIPGLGIASANPG
jgi:UDP-N-acetylmuramoylalanine--D-glutamate ligase